MIFRSSSYDLSLLYCGRPSSKIRRTAADRAKATKAVIFHIFPAKKASAPTFLSVRLLYHATMNKTCTICGIVPMNHVCPYATPKKHTRSPDGTIEKFRSSQRWKNKTRSIKSRDLHLCRVCRSDRHETRLQYNSEDLEVHHIVPLVEDFNKRLDDDNLITLCARHHKMAERGQITREELRSLLPPL